jgi:hypothetical protein
MGFYTRDFQETFGVPYSIVQLMAASGKLPMEGPSAKGRGSRRHYTLEAAYRVGLTSRLRGLQVSLEQCNRIVDPLVRLFDTITRAGAYGGSDIEKYHPFKTLNPGPYTFFLELFSLYYPVEPPKNKPRQASAKKQGEAPSELGPTEHTWMTVRVIMANGAPLFPAPYFLISPQGPPGQPEPQQLLFADMYLRINLTAITRILRNFVEAHPRQFPQAPL